MRPATLFRRGAYTSLGVLATAAAAVAVYTVRGVLILALIALFLAVSLDPAVSALSRWHIRRGLAILVVVLVVLGLVVAFLQSVIPAMAEQFQAMVRDFPHYLASLQHRSASVRQISGRYHLTSQISAPTRPRAVPPIRPASSTAAGLSWTGRQPTPTPPTLTPRCPAMRRRPRIPARPARLLRAPRSDPAQPGNRRRGLTIRRPPARYGAKACVTAGRWDLGEPAQDLSL